MFGRIALIGSVCALLLMVQVRILHAQSCVPSANQIAIYTSTNYSGSCRVLNVGRYDNATQMGVSNDSISSLLVGANVRASLFENTNLGGKEAFFEGGYDYNNVGSSLNDKTSSILVSYRHGTQAAFWYLGNFPNEITTSLTQNIQGIASDDEYWYITNETSIAQFPLTSSLLSNGARVRLATMPSQLTSKGCNHYGDADVKFGYLFIPVEGCKEGTTEVPIVAIFDPRDLSLIAYDYLYFQGAWPEGGKKGKAAWLAIDPASGELLSSRGDVGPSDPIFRYTIDWSAIVRDPNPRIILWNAPKTEEYLHNPRTGGHVNLGTMQGGVFNEDGSLLYLSNGSDACSGNGDGIGIRIFDTWDYSLVARSGNAYGPFNFENSCGLPKYEETEGLDYRNMNVVNGRFKGVLHAILLDNDASGVGYDDAYIKHYDL